MFITYKKTKIKKLQTVSSLNEARKPFGVMIFVEPADRKVKTNAYTENNFSFYGKRSLSPGMSAHKACLCSISIQLTLPSQEEMNCYHKTSLEYSSRNQWCLYLVIG